MGTPLIFWINEEPIREYVSRHGRDPAVIEEIGNKVLRLATERRIRVFTLFNAFGVFRADEHMMNFFRSGMPLPDWSFFMWTGKQLESLPYMTAVKYDELCQLVDQSAGADHVIGRSEVIPHAVASVYWLYEPFVSDLAHEKHDQWPCVEMGKAVLSLMIDGESQAAVRNHHPGICRACSFVDHQATVLVWGQNWLGCLTQIPDGGRSRLREILSAR